MVLSNDESDALYEAIKRDLEALKKVDEAAAKKKAAEKAKAKTEAETEKRNKTWRKLS
jgi:hypothetical protein